MRAAGWDGARPCCATLRDSYPPDDVIAPERLCLSNQASR